MKSYDLDAMETWEISELYNLDDTQEEILKAALDAGFDTEDAVNKILHNELSLIEGVTTYRKLGYYIAEALELPNFAYSYFDFDKFGAELASTEDGYLTSYGWLTFC